MSKPSRYPYAFRLVRLYANTLLILAGLIVRVRRKGALPEGPVIICPNHSSYLDIVVMYRVFRRYFVFMGKAEINNWPLFHIFFSKGMNISVNRSNPHSAHQAYERCKRELAQGHSVVIFPEGTIPPTAPQLKTFKNGAFKLSMETGVPIVPVTYLNNWKRLQAGSALRRLGGPGFCDVVVHEPVFPHKFEGDIVAFKNEVFSIIAQPLNERYGSK
ncbi:MAG: hypothetical protein Kow0075_13000 [Salibacteraceae bacterium]